MKPPDSLLATVRVEASSMSVRLSRRWLRAAGLFGLEIPCSRHLSRLPHRGRGVMCSLRDCQLHLFGPLAGQFVAGCRSVFRLGLLLHWLVPPIGWSLLVLCQVKTPVLRASRQGAFAAQPSIRFPWHGLYSCRADVPPDFELASSRAGMEIEIYVSRCSLFPAMPQGLLVSEDRSAKIPDC